MPRTKINLAPVSRLEQIRRNVRLRQQDVASRAGVSRTLISLTERGYVPAGPTRAAIARGLGVSQIDIWPEEPAFDPERPDE